METRQRPLIGLIIRSLPYQQRSSRSQLDVALVAANLELPLRIYFQGAAALQLLEHRNPEPASLPPGYRGWASLETMTEVTFFVEPACLNVLHASKLSLLMAVTSFNLGQMRANWQECQKVLIL